MPREYRPRHSVPLDPGVSYRRPPQPADWVQFEDPAMAVFTDFRYVRPRTVAPEEAIDAALERMKEEGVRLLLVVGEDDEIVGIITANDIQGEKPMQLIRERRVTRPELAVRDIMEPQPEIPVLQMLSLNEARVGHILATLRALERQHVLVVEVEESTGRQCVRGLFSKSQIRKQMHRRELDDIPPAHSLAEMVTRSG